MRHGIIDSELILLHLHILLDMEIDDSISDPNGIALDIVLSQIGDAVVGKCCNINCASLNNLAQFVLNDRQLVVSILAYLQRCCPD